MVGADGEIDKEPLLLCHVATTSSPLVMMLAVGDGVNVAAKEVVEGVCVPTNPAKMMREVVNSGIEVANETVIVFWALATPEFWAASKLSTREPKTFNGYASPATVFPYVMLARGLYRAPG